MLVVEVMYGQQVPPATLPFCFQIRSSMSKCPFACKVNKANNYYGNSESLEEVA